VDPVILLDRTINYGLYYACHYLNSGKKLAREILNENIERSSITVGIPVKLGFHSRPSLLVAKIVQHFGGQVELVVGQDRFDASSVLDIQWAGGKIQKEKITEVTFRRRYPRLECHSDSGRRQLWGRYHGKRRAAAPRIELPEMIGAVIVAGGNGSRMKSAVRKQYLNLSGVPDYRPHADGL
jgi:phosphotransferase system HPr-like phosphotransfer protein